MTIGDIVTQLKYGELRSVAIKDDNIAITSYINLALIALYGRFNLKTNEHLLTLDENTTEYTLPTDLLILENVYNEAGQEIQIDNEESPVGVFLVSFDTLQVSNPVTGNVLSLIYVAVPATLIFDDTDAGTIAASLALTVPIPPQLLEPLLHYVGYRAHGSMNGDVKAENNTHFMRYEASCKRIENLGLVKRDIAPAYVNRKEPISEENDYEYDPDADIL